MKRLLLAPLFSGLLGGYCFAGIPFIKKDNTFHLRCAWNEVRHERELSSVYYDLPDGQFTEFTLNEDENTAIFFNSWDDNQTFSFEIGIGKSSKIDTLAFDKESIKLIEKTIMKDNSITTHIYIIDRLNGTITREVESDTLSDYYSFSKGLCEKIKGNELLLKEKENLF